ncbi:hypothetical protein [Streptomyces sp. NPDC019890]|uniref:hypothetical protein n=1 Tax=Streptomyces sp. NPDC019890 TaxID=3365064 RepID=UPI00384FBB53
MTDGAVYKFLMSVDARGSGGYLDGAKLRMRQRVYGLANASFAAVGVGPAMVYREDRGDGFIAAIDARIPPAQLIGPWLAELHQRLRAGNEDLGRPLGLRVGMHVGPVEQDANGLAGEAMDLVCRLADAEVTKQVLAASARDLVAVVSDALYQAVVRHGGRFIEPHTYRPAPLELKEGPATAWFHVPGQERPPLPEDEGFRAPQDGPAGRDQEAGAEDDEAPRPSPTGPTSADRPSVERPPAERPKTDDTQPDERSGREGARFDIDSHGGEVAVVDRAVFQQPVTFGGRGPRRDDERRSL